MLASSTMCSAVALPTGRGKVCNKAQINIKSPVVEVKWQPRKLASIIWKDWRGSHSA